MVSPCTTGAMSGPGMFHPFSFSELLYSRSSVVEKSLAISHWKHVSVLLPLSACLASCLQRVLLTMLLLLCFPLECNSVWGWVSVFVCNLHRTVFEFMFEYTLELLCIPMCVCCGSLCVFIKVCICAHTHTHTGAHLAPLIC